MLRIMARKTTFISYRHTLLSLDWPRSPWPLLVSANLRSERFRSGFKWGCAVGVLASAVPNGLYRGGNAELKFIMANSSIANLQMTVKSTVPVATGFTGQSNLIYAVTSPWNWCPVPALLFFGCTWLIMFAPGRFLPKWSPPGMEVIVATALATFFSIFSGYNGGVVGEIPMMDNNSGLSLFGGSLTLPVEVLDLQRLLDAPLVERFGGSWLKLITSATLLPAMNFLSMMGLAAMFEAEDGISWSAPRELFAQGVSCIVAGLTGSAPVSASMSRSLVSRMTGTTSSFACIVTAMVWIYCLPYMSIMSATPKAALSAVIVSAVVKGVLFPKDLLSLKGTDFAVGWGTAIATALTSPTVGFGIGLMLALTMELLSRKLQVTVKTKKTC